MRRQISKAGLDPDSVPTIWVNIVGAAMAKWVSSTSEGFNYISNILEFEFAKGDDSQQYIVDTGDGALDLDADDVHTVYGCLVKGRPVAPSRLHSMDILTNECHGCGVVKHCVSDISNPVTSRLEWYCNHCLMYHEHPRVNDFGNSSRCLDCRAVDCSHHPSKGGGH